MLKWIAMVLAGVLLAGCNPVQQAKDARAQVDVFHERLNAGEDQAIWTNAGEQLRKATSREDFVRLLGTVRKSLGPVEGTSQTNVKMNTSPQGSFTTLQMETHFERGRGVETFVFSGSGDSLRLVGYNINSSDMMADVFENYADEPSSEATGSAEASDSPTIRIAPAGQ